MYENNETNLICPMFYSHFLEKKPSVFMFIQQL